MGFQLPFPQLVSWKDFWTINRPRLMKASSLPIDCLGIPGVFFWSHGYIFFCLFTPPETNIGPKKMGGWKSTLTIFWDGHFAGGELLNFRGVFLFFIQQLRF